MNMKTHPSYTRFIEAAEARFNTVVAAQIARELTSLGIPVSPQMVGNWKTRGVSSDCVVAVADALGVTPQWLVSGPQAAQRTGLINTQPQQQNSGPGLINMPPRSQRPLLDAITQLADKLDDAGLLKLHGYASCLIEHHSLSKANKVA